MFLYEECEESSQSAFTLLYDNDGKWLIPFSKQESS